MNGDIWHEFFAMVKHENKNHSRSSMSKNLFYNDDGTAFGFAIACSSGASSGASFEGVGEDKRSGRHRIGFRTTRLDIVASRNI
jgi:hypothetical protein